MSNAAYGVLCNSDDIGNIDYLTGVEVSDPSDIPKGLDYLLLAPQTYAVFPHRSHVSQIRHSWRAIFTKWCTAAGREMIDAPQFERYGENFDAETGIGDIEIWIPIKE
jgi:AraC family transcriptional regulator